MNKFCTLISSFDGDGSMSVVLKRPSILTLAMSGKIPNPLLSAATKLFDFAPKAAEVSLKEIGEILHIVAEASLLSPAYEEVKDLLTDQQLMEIYHYAKEGACGLENFRSYRRVYTGSDSCGDDEKACESNA